METFLIQQEQNDNSFQGQIIKDGIVDYEQYQKASPKILWILKEPNSKETGWEMREKLSNLKEEKAAGSWARTFAPIVYTTNGIFTGEDWDTMGDFNIDHDILNVMQKAAFINVKKTIGGSYSNWNTIRTYYLENKASLHQQIKMIAPEVIIFGNTFSFFDDDFLEQFGVLQSNKENHDLHIYENENVLLLSAYHSNNRKITQKRYCNLILDAYQAWKQKYNK